MTGAAAQSHGCIRNADPRRTPHAVKGVIDSGGKTLAPDSRRDRPAGRLTSSSMSSTQAPARAATSTRRSMLDLDAPAAAGFWFWGERRPQIGHGCRHLTDSSARAEVCAPATHIGYEAS